MDKEEILNFVSRVIDLAKTSSSLLSNLSHASIISIC